MAIILSILTAISYGAGDYAGGRATRNTSVVLVVLGAHTIGLLAMLATAPFLAETYSSRDVVLGAVGALAGLVGLAMLYRRLAVGPMSVVAPTTAITSAAVPALWGLLRGERLGLVAAVGLVVAVLAIGLVSRSKDESGAPVTPAVIAESLLAGTGFGVLFIFLAETDSTSAPWPIVAGRVATVSVLVVVVLLNRTALRAGTGDQPFPWRWVIIAGILDSVANLTFLLATGEGDLAIVAVLSALYPVTTVLMARSLDGERMTTTQVIGLCLALLGTALISLG